MLTETVLLRSSVRVKQFGFCVHGCLNIDKITHDTTLPTDFLRARTIRGKAWQFLRVNCFRNRMNRLIYSTWGLENIRNMRFAVIRQTAPLRTIWICGGGSSLPMF